MSASFDTAALEALCECGHEIREHARNRKQERGACLHVIDAALNFCKCTQFKEASVKGKKYLGGREGLEAQEPEQQKLPDSEAKSEPAQPQPVRGELFLAQYVRPHYDRDKDDKRFVALEFSLPLTKAHSKIVPDMVRKFWKQLSDGGAKKMGDIEVDPHIVVIYLAPDDKPWLTIDVAEICRANLSVVEETGSDAAKDVIRYSFRVRHESDGPVNENLREFADTKFGDSCWLKCTEIQGKLPL
jgi:hypothetical protein